jgi:hypothetical protein
MLGRKDSIGSPAQSQIPHNSALLEKAQYLEAAPAYNKRDLKQNPDLADFIPLPVDVKWHSLCRLTRYLSCL